MDTLPDSFADLLAPFAPEQFFDQVQGRHPLHIPGAADKFAFAMSWDTLNRLLDQSSIWTPYLFKMVLDKVTLQPRQYARDGYGRDGKPGLMVDFDKVRAFIKQGASLVLDDVEALTPGLKRIAEILGRDLKGKVQGNLYCSWQAHQAFPAHFDVHDVYAMQVIGEKRWRIYQRHFKDPIIHPAFKGLDAAFHEANRGPLSMDVVMRPGDLLYLPRGFYHEALAESGASIHLTYSFTSMIGLDVVSLLYENGVMDEVLRGSLPDADARDGKALDEHLMRIAGRLREMLREPRIREQLETGLRNFRFPTQRLKLPDDAQ